jgi:hypothetical protein
LRPLSACGPYPSTRDPASSHAALPTCVVHTRSPPPGPCPCAHLAAVADGLHLRGGVRRAPRARSGGAMVPVGRPRGRASAAPFPPPRGHDDRRGRPEAASCGGGFPRDQPLARGPSGGRRLPWLVGRARLPDAASCLHGWCGPVELKARRPLCSVAKLRSPFRRRTPPRRVGRVAAWLRANRRSCFRSSVMSGLGQMSLPVQVLQRLVAVKDTMHQQ